MDRLSELAEQPRMQRHRPQLSPLAAAIAVETNAAAEHWVSAPPDLLIELRC
jgi:hypothetical protein